MRFGPSILDRVWFNYNYEVKGRTYVRYGRTYQRLQRSTRICQEFELWIWEQGGQIVQEDHQRYVQFNDEERAILFQLRWA